MKTEKLKQKTAADEVVTRQNLADAPADLALFTAMLTKPGNVQKSFNEATQWLQQSPYFITADLAYAAAGGDTEIRWTPQPGFGIMGKTLGGLFMSFLFVFHVRPALALHGGKLPDWLCETRLGRHFDGRPPSPYNDLRSDPRALYGLQHFDRLGHFKEAVEYVISRNALVSRDEVSDELAAFIPAYLQLQKDDKNHPRHHLYLHFEWLENQ